MCIRDSTWVAFLSTTTTRAWDHVNDVAGGWWNLASPPQLVFQGKTALIPRAIQFDESGVSQDDGVTNSSPVWTGTVDVTLLASSADNCMDWTSDQATDYARYGNLESLAWHDAGRLRCNGLGRLYCFEQ